MPPEGGERHAALVRLVAVVEQVAGHGGKAPVRAPLFHRGATLITHPDLDP